MKNLVFVSLPKVEIVFPPGSIAILSSVAKINGRDCKVFDYNLDLLDALDPDEWNALESWNNMAIPDLPSDLESKIEKVFKTQMLKYIDEHTEFVCFSVFSYFSNRIAEKTLAWYKEISQIPSVVGGSGISTDTSSSKKEIFGEYLMKNHLADYVMFGEGELILDSLLKGRADYPGINCNNPQQIDDLGILPIPTYEYFDMKRYHGTKILVTGSRGCVRKCTFCDIELTWPKFRFRPAEHVIKEITQNFYAYGITEFEFTDSLINGSITNFDRFNQLLIEAKQKDPNLIPIKYQGQFICRPRTQQKEHTYELMHRAGCSMLITGIESFSTTVRNHMRKHFNDEDIDYHFEQCAKWGISNVILMIVGYPTETAEDHQQTLEKLLRYKVYADMGIIFMIRWGLTMHLYEHTPIMGMLDQIGIDMSDDIKFDSVYSWTPSTNPNNTLQERIRRRLEIHETCVKLGYPMPRVREELLLLKNLAKKSQLMKNKKLFKIETN